MTPPDDSIPKRKAIMLPVVPVRNHDAGGEVITTTREDDRYLSTNAMVSPKPKLGYGEGA